MCNDSGARVLFVHPTLEELARSCEFDSIEGTHRPRRAVRALAVRGERGSARRAARGGDVFSNPRSRWDSQGRPGKGVLLSHRSRVLTFFAMGVEYGCYGPEDRALAIAPLFHGAGFAFAIAPIFFGGYCVDLPPFRPERGDAG